MNRKELIKLLKEHGIIQFGKFKLSSGKESDYYIDMRRALSIPVIYREVIEAMSQLVSNIDLVAGIESGGVPWAAMLAYQLGIGMIYVRKQPKEHGTSRFVEGIYTSNQRVLIIDDVMTTGSSIIRGIELIEAAGLRAVQAMVIVDRSGGGIDLKVPLQYVLKAEEILDEFNRINQ